MILKLKNILWNAPPEMYSNTTFQNMQSIMYFVGMSNGVNPLTRVGSP